MRGWILAVVAPLIMLGGCHQCRTQHELELAAVLVNVVDIVGVGLMTVVEDQGME